MNSNEREMPWIDKSVWEAIEAARQKMSERQPKQTDAEAAARRAELDRQMAEEAEMRAGFQD